MELPSAARSSVIQTAAELPCWCRSGRWAEVFKTRRFGLLRCTGCGGYRIDPPPISSGGECEAFYTGYYRAGAPATLASNGGGSGCTSWFWSVAAQVSDLARPPRSVLDIGCGEGHLCEQLRRKGWEQVQGLDISKSRIERARRRYPHLVFHDRALPQTGIQPGSLDLIIMEAVIEHLPEPARFLEQVRDYLAPGGRVVLTTPNMESGHFRLLGRRWTGMLSPHAHIFLFTAASIETLLRAANLTPVRTGNFDTPLYRPAEYVRRLLRGDVKGTVWRACQEAGAVYGRLIHSGPMLYAVATKAD